MERLLGFAKLPDPEVVHEPDPADPATVMFTATSVVVEQMSVGALTDTVAILTIARLMVSRTTRQSPLLFELKTS